MLTEYAVLASVTPICSAIAMNRLLKTSSRIGSARRADRMRAPRRLDALEHEVAALRERRAPAGLDDGRRVVLANHRGAGDRVAGPKVRRGRRRRRRGTRRRCRSGSSRIGASGAARGANAGHGVRRRRASGRSPRPRRPRRRAACPASGSRTAAGTCARIRRPRRAAASTPVSSVVSVPSYLTCSVRLAAIRSAGMPCAATSARAALSSARELRLRPPPASSVESASRPPAASARARRRAPSRTRTARRPADAAARASCRARRRRGTRAGRRRRRSSTACTR